MIRIKAVDSQSVRLRGVSIAVSDWADSIREYDSPDTLIYADPPYTQGTRLGGDYRNDFADDSQHILLAEALNSCKSKVVLSGYPSRLYFSLYGEWRVKSRKAGDFGVVNGAKGSRKTEVVWIRR